MIISTDVITDLLIICRWVIVARNRRQTYVYRSKAMFLSVLLCVKYSYVVSFAGTCLFPHVCRQLSKTVCFARPPRCGGGERRLAGALVANLIGRPALVSVATESALFIDETLIVP